MVHGASFVKFSHQASGFSICFNALDALKEWRRVCYDRKAPKVCYSKEWSKDRAEHLAEIPVVEYDWTFHSRYSGTLSDGWQAEESKHKIPYERLKEQEQIVMWDGMVLFQDELHDNGDCLETVKYRVMNSGFFCLHRLFLRVDGVVATIHDTRVYHAFGSDVVLQEWQVRSNTYEEMREKDKIPTDLSKLADDNYMYEKLDKKELVTRQINLKK